MTTPDDGRELHLDAWERRATIVNFISSHESDFKPIIACACASALATSTLLTYLAISEFKAWRLTRGRQRDSYVRQLSRAKFKNQGYFWLVNLFCAGTFTVEPSHNNHRLCSVYRLGIVEL
jgi:hypothetical protein